MVSGAFPAYPNFRALGGQRCGDGRIVRDDLVYRSEAMLAPSAADARRLAACGIRLVCDLRSAHERRRAPNGFWTGLGVECLDLDLMAALAAGHRPWPTLRADPTAEGARAAMRGVYAGLPAAAAAPVARLFRRIADGDVPVLVHCTAGKDRTGFVSALLLAALAVPYPAILADYLASHVRRSPEAVAATRAMAEANIGTELPGDALDVLMGIDETYLAESFAAIDRDHGGVDRYLSAAGLDDAGRAALRARLLRPQPIT